MNINGGGFINQSPNQQTNMQALMASRVIKGPCPYNGVN